MKFNLKCNTNCHDHIDYRIPIAPEKSDYRTASQIAHDYFYPIPQEFDCRVKYKPWKSLTETNIRIKDELVPVYKKDYVFKQKQEDLLVKYGRSHHINDVQYIRNLQERLDKKPPPLIPIRASETKTSFGIPKFTPNRREVLAPVVEGRCEISGLARPLQRTVPTHEGSYWKYLDIYLPQSKLSHRPFTEKEMFDARKDLPSRYNTKGPNPQYVLGGPITGNKEIYDHQVMSPQYPNKNLSRAWKMVPHRGMQSEYNGSFTTHTFSDLYPYLYDNGVAFPLAPNVDATPWQIFATPAMYCTDYCHLGSGGYSVRSVLNCKTQATKTYPHKPLESCKCKK